MKLISMKKPALKMIFLKEAFEEMKNTVGSYKVESGGILIGNRDDFIVQKYYHDTQGSCFGAGYDPDVNFLNQIVIKEREENGLDFLGFAHSHPRGFSRLSGDYGNGIGDLGYIKTIFNAMPSLNQFLVPIMYSSYDGNFEFFPYVALRNSKEIYKEAELEIISLPEILNNEKFISEASMTLDNQEFIEEPSSITINTSSNTLFYGYEPYKQQSKFVGKRIELFSLISQFIMRRILIMFKAILTFSNQVFTSKTERKKAYCFDTSRLNGAVNVSQMESSHIVAVGVGGAMNLYENLVRSGLGKLTVIDFDIVDNSNITTQGYYCEDIGKPKVKALEDKLRRINPDIKYTGIVRSFLDFSEEEIQELVKDSDMLLLMTDNFYAQARGNRVSLKYNISSVFAMVYENAYGAEISFNIPERTPGCHRCAVSSRYEAYRNGFVNNIGSQGTTIFSTHYLNSCLGFISLAILHRNRSGGEFADLFDTSYDRNFIQLRMNPSYKDQSGVFKQNFDSPFAIAFDAVWHEIEPDCPPKYKTCPDCKGFGALKTDHDIQSTRLIFTDNE